MSACQSLGNNPILVPGLKWCKLSLAPQLQQLIRHRKSKWPLSYVVCTASTSALPPQQSHVVLPGAWGTSSGRCQALPLANIGTRILISDCRRLSKLTCRTGTVHRVVTNSHAFWTPNPFASGIAIPNGPDNDVRTETESRIKSTRPTVRHTNIHAANGYLK
jgi:hypothetical protein